MKNYQIKANEKFFARVKSLLKENGSYLWPDQMEFFLLKQGKFTGTKSAYEKISKVVSKKFLEENFSYTEN